MNHTFTAEEIQRHVSGEVLLPPRVKEATPLFSSHFYTNGDRSDWGIGVEYYGESPFRVMRPKTEEWLKDNPWFWEGFEAFWEKHKDKILKSRLAAEEREARLWSKISQLVSEYNRT